jgi:hypothetical protein
MVDDGEKVGLKAAVDAVGVEAVEMQRAEQLALLPTESLQADLRCGDEAAERSGAGRPPGSKNKRTAEWTDYILSRHVSPLVFLAQTYTRPAADLAKELKCKTEDAFRIQVAAAKELAPYVHQKQPVAVEVSSTGVVQLVLEASPNIASQFAGRHQGGDGTVVIEGTIIEEGEENEND